MSERMIEGQPQEFVEAPPVAPPMVPAGTPAGGAPARKITNDERVSTMLADRACTRCAFNLIGQPIVREKHYGLLIARCPECGTVAALQEYPALGRWANRWAALLAGLWFLVVTAGTMAVAGIVTGFTHGAGHSTSERVAEVIKQKYIAHETAKGTAVEQINWWWIGDPLWWEAQDKRQIIAEAGGWSGAVRWRGLAIWIFAACILVPVGACWAVLMAHRRGLGLVITAAPMLVFAGIFWAISNLGSSTFLSVHDLAQRMLWPVVLPLSLLCAGIALFAGVLLGRPLARLAVRATLPPRLRVPLGWLWTCDGLPPPRAGG